MTTAIDSFYGTQRPYAVSTNDPEAHWGDTVVAQGHADCLPVMLATKVT